MKQDDQIYAKIPCASPKCKNRGFIIVADKFICGDCLVKLNKKRDKMVTEMLGIGS